MKKEIVFIGIILCLLACNRENYEYKVPVFKEVIERNIVALNTDFVFDVGGLYITDSCLIVKQKSELNSNSFQMFDPTTGEFIEGFGQYGRARGELLEPMVFISVDNERNSLYAGGLNQHKMIKFDLSNNKNITFDETKYDTHISARFFSYVKENRFLIGHEANKPRFCLYDKKRTLVDSYNLYPVVKKENEDFTLIDNFFVYNSYLAIKPDGTKFVNVTNCGLIMDIFEVKNDSIVPLFTKRYYEPTFKESGQNDWDRSIKAYVSFTSTDKYIYMIINGTTKSRPIKTLSLFDWEGNPVKQYNLNEPIIRVAINEKSKKVFVLAENDNGEYYLGYFDL